MAEARLPARRTTFSPVSRSVATAANGMGSSSNRTTCILEASRAKRSRSFTPLIPPNGPITSPDWLSFIQVRLLLGETLSEGSGTKIGFVLSDIRFVRSSSSTT